MALFGNKKSAPAKEKAGAKKEKTSEVAKKDTPAISSNNKSAPKTGALIRPRITEKASYVSEKSNAYVFDIPLDASKGAVRNAFVATYKINPAKVAIVRTPAKAVFSRGRYGMGNRGKKAYIYLKKGDKIEII